MPTSIPLRVVLLGAFVTVLAMAARQPIAAALPQAVVEPQAPPAAVAATDPAAVLRVMKQAADWQLAHPSAHPPYDWTQAAFYTGVMALVDVAGDPKYAAAMRAMGEANQWRPGPRPGHADDWAVVATYARLGQIDHDKKLNKGLLDRAA